MPHGRNFKGALNALSLGLVRLSAESKMAAGQNTNWFPILPVSNLSGKSTKHFCDTYLSKMLFESVPKVGPITLKCLAYMNYRDTC